MENREESHSHEDIEKINQEYMNEVSNYFTNKFEEYIDLFTNLIESEDFEKVNIPKQLEDARDHVTEDELKILVVFASMRKAMSNPAGAEMMDVSEYIVEQLEEASLIKPFSTEFINSIYNFKVVYTVLFSLLDLAENGRYRGEKMSQDYKMGVIDSIVALRKYHSTSGFGDIAWERDYNPAANKDF